jgi:ubiquitin-protein ligase
MDLELNSDTNNNMYIHDNSSNYFNNNFANQNSNKFGIYNSPDINIFSKNKNSIYALDQNHPLENNKKNQTSGELTLCEGRLLNDLAEFKRSKIVGTICQIKLNDFTKLENDTFEIIIEYVSFFSVKFIFDSNYPCSPPKVVYFSGLKPKNIFDDEGNALIESIKKIKWTPSIWFSTLVYSIELLISSYINNEKNNNCMSNCENKNCNRSFFMKKKMQKYGKRKWDAYLDECNDYYSKEFIILPELEKNLKQLKIK